jgi:hypothetical protein
MFCGPETVDVSQGEVEGNIDGPQNIYCFPEVPVNKYFIMYQ